MQEPRGGIPEAKAVAPRIHVLQQPLATHALKITCENDLHVTHRRLFEVIAACVPIEMAAPFLRHAERMTGLVQQGMYRRVLAHIDRVADEARLAVAPETTCDWFLGSLQVQREAIACK